ncbi:MAG: GNAT family N-acetyltransferase [Bacteroidia bacterium]|nr:GNAT family N-acetyltransferase [Bacteroidia bacterium]
MKNLYIFTEGDKHSGMGHLMRCLAIATTLRDMFRIEFVLPSDHTEAISIVLKNRFRKSVVNDWEEALIIPDAGDIVLMDSYRIPAGIDVQLAELGARIVALVDETDKCTAHAFICPAGDVRASVVQDPPLLFFSGPAFAPLRAEILQNSRMPVYSEKKNTLICFGGADPKNYLLRTARVLATAYPGRYFTLVTGPAYGAHEELREFLATHPSFSLQNNLTAAGMAEIFRTHALAITSASTVAYEACASRIPLLVLPTADNQQPMFDFLTNHQLADGVLSPEELTLPPSPLLPGKPAVQEKYFDGNSDRRLREIFQSLSDDLTLRKIHALDEEMLLEWSNEEGTRNNSFNTTAITKEAHHTWFETKLNNKSSAAWIAEDIREPFAFIRIDPSKDSFVSGNAVISVNLKKEFRGKGLGAKVLRRACLHYFAQHPGHCISALIKNGNEASARAFTEAGFSFVNRFLYQGTQTIQMNKKL